MQHPEPAFAELNAGYNHVFRAQRLSLGLVAPIERYPSSRAPTMQGHLAQVQLAERLGFSALWLRDVPFDVPAFGDAGQLYDPWVYLGFLAASTSQIALGVSSIVLPLRHPVHVAKAAASVDQLSGGRLILGIASGDRPIEYPAMNLSFGDRGQRFRESYASIRALAQTRPRFSNAAGSLDGGVDLLPKPTGARLPLLVTGGSQQDPAWIAEHGDGWMLYPRDVASQGQIIGGWRERVAAFHAHGKPVMQPLYLDLLQDPEAPATPIHLGFRTGSQALLAYLQALQQVGVNHVALNLRFNQADIPTTLNRLADEVLPHFPPKESPCP